MLLHLFQNRTIRKSQRGVNLVLGTIASMYLRVRVSVFAPLCETHQYDRTTKKYGRTAAFRHPDWRYYLRIFLTLSGRKTGWVHSQRAHTQNALFSEA